MKKYCYEVVPGDMIVYTDDLEYNQFYFVVSVDRHKDYTTLVLFTFNDGFQMWNPSPRAVFNNVITSGEELLGKNVQVDSTTYHLCVK